MIDITKEEFWDSKEEIVKKENGKSKVKEFIKRNKMVTTLLIGLGTLMTANTILIYNFFRILTNI